LADNISALEVNRRIDSITEIEEKNKYNLEFNVYNHPEIEKLSASVPLSQVFIIENTIIEP